METLKRIGKALLFPPVAIIILLIPISAAWLAVAFLMLGSQHVVSCIGYAVSAYALTVISVRVPYFIKLGKRIKNENKYIVRISSDAKLRLKISLYSSLFINTAYAALQLGLGVYHGSVWFYSLAAYYILLVIMRAFLLRDVRVLEARGRDSELRRYRFCGIVLLLMNLALVLMVFFITYFNRGFTHHYITTIAMAAYTFTSMSMAIVNIVRYRRYNSPVMSASKAISLAAACVSMLTLETAMFNAFSEENTEEIRGIMTLLTGVAVCLFVMGMAVFMIIHSTKQIKLNKNKGN